MFHLKIVFVAFYKIQFNTNCFLLIPFLLDCMRLWSVHGGLYWWDQQRDDWKVDWNGPNCWRRRRRWGERKKWSRVDFVRRTRIVGKGGLWVMSFIYKYKTSTTYPLYETTWRFVLINKWHSRVQSALPTICLYPQSRYDWFISCLKEFQKIRCFCCRPRHLNETDWDWFTGGETRCWNKK